MTRLQHARTTIAEHSEHNLPEWQHYLSGASLPEVNAAEPELSNWRKDGQEFASQTIEKIHTHQYLNASNPATRARLCSSSGPRTSQWLTTIPTEPLLRLPDELFRCAMARRAGLPVTALPQECEGCHRILDEFGHHRNACSHTARLHARHKTINNIWCQILREAGVNIRTTGHNRNTERYLRHTHLRTNTIDNRRMDIITPGLNGVFGGIPFLLDGTCISPLSGSGNAVNGAANTDGTILIAADRRNRTRDYPDVEASSFAQLRCLGWKLLADSAFIVIC